MKTNKVRKLRIYFETVRYLKFKQLFFGVFYRLKKYLFKASFRNANGKTPDSFHLNLDASIDQPQSLVNSDFTFLNLPKSFDGGIDWNFLGHGKLWCYNLNYFDYLNQKKIDAKEAISVLESFCSEPHNRREGTEPYPISLRGINWIKYFSSHKISNLKYNQLLFAHYQYLASNLEYHLLGNHLLENAFSLFFGAYYFHNDDFYKKSEKILLSELNEQILDDGGHFELSPMYHQIMLFRLLDVINVVKNNPWNNRSHLSFFITKAQAMLVWLDKITFSNGDVPMVNDSAYGISPSSRDLIDYAKRLGIQPKANRLSLSGYRMIRMDRMELFIDVGNIGPDYIPGHAHSDTFNFVLYTDHQPVIVDTATSTYERNSVRQSERSTYSHNTVAVNNKDQSEVWASFRVGRRAKINELQEGENFIKAAHSGYQSQGIQHARQWHWGTDGILIIDDLRGKGLIDEAVAYFHFHPSVSPLLDHNMVYASNTEFKWKGALQVKIEEYYFAEGFNKRCKSKVVIVAFKNHLETHITL